MARKGRIVEIQNVKAVLDEARSFFISSFAMTRLANEAEMTESKGGLLDIYPVRAISRTEVECRRIVREIVEFTPDYAKRAVSLLANAKPDYDLLLSIAGNEVKFSDIVAHSVAFSNLKDILSTFEQLLDVSLADELPKVTNPYGYEFDSSQPSLISNYSQTCAAIGEIYAIRHRVCHEGLDPEIRELKGIGAKLHELAGFLGALNGFVVRRIYPNLPRNQMEINQQAHQSCVEAREEMQKQLAAFRLRCPRPIKEYGHWPESLNALDKSQAAWEKYVEAQKILRHDPAGGGSIGPCLRANEEELLTRERTKRLEWFTTRREGEL